MKLKILFMSANPSKDLNLDEKIKIIPYEALSLLFNSVKEDNLKLVFLNSCYSKVQADAILESIDYLIGMNDDIEDDSAKTFSIQFYSFIA